MTTMQPASAQYPYGTGFGTKVTRSFNFVSPAASAPTAVVGGYYDLRISGTFDAFSVPGGVLDVIANSVQVPLSSISVFAPLATPGSTTFQYDVLLDPLPNGGIETFSLVPNGNSPGSGRLDVSYQSVAYVPAVPESSTAMSFGILLAFALLGLTIRFKRRSA